MKQKILVLDDSPFMLATIGDMLKQLNYEVTTLDNGEEACKKAKSSRFDMIITDLNMPVMDGLEFTKQVRAYPNCRFVPIVMLSSETDSDKVSQAKQMGISTFLRKPPSESQLKTLLQITLGKRKAPRIPIKLEVYFSDGKNITDYTTCYTLNISVGGLFLETTSPLSPGVELKLKFSHPEKDELIVCRGRVAWVNSLESPTNKDHPPGMGVAFVDFEEERQIQELIRSRPWKS
jgi:two-component system chemotaxis response regulator CheY